MKTTTEAELKKMVSDGIPVVKIASLLETEANTIYKVLKLLGIKKLERADKGLSEARIKKTLENMSMGKSISFSARELEMNPGQLFTLMRSKGHPTNLQDFFARKHAEVKA